MDRQYHNKIIQTWVRDKVMDIIEHIYDAFNIPFNNELLEDPKGFSDY